ncbi:hypothetical protein [Lactobacillus taiwanensis]|uniref:hypothetical protein n=1 Tax=Lactobacillus taiwanensis TaxID=508451 RepID=UPI002430042B|nr:hypothetical protein [Lactobacillus taiwanensis]
MALTKIKTGKNKGRYRVRIQPIDPVSGKAISIPSKIAKNLQEAKKARKINVGTVRKIRSKCRRRCYFC